MHLDKSVFPEEYKQYTQKKIFVLLITFLLLTVIFLLSVSLGAVNIPLDELLPSLLGLTENGKYLSIIWHIRLPHALTAIVAGAGLSITGAALQSILRNPLGSPFTLGLSQSAAFGAAFSIMILGTGVMYSSSADAVTITNPYATTAAAFLFCLITTFVLMAIARFRQARPEVMILAGVAIGSLFTAGTMFLQYFADDTQLAAMVFWTFGDVGRVSWTELAVISVVVLFSCLFHLFNRWNYNALDAGNETAKGLGVFVERIRLFGMLVSALMTAVIIAFMGIIGFVGLVGPHIMRRLIGDDHRFLLPCSAIAGAVILLAADMAARLILVPNVFPVAILTAFLGAPVFLYLLLRGYRR
jgi:iron complex transport system permease protein